MVKESRIDKLAKQIDDLNSEYLKLRKKYPSITETILLKYNSFDTTAINGLNSKEHKALIKLMSIGAQLDVLNKEHSKEYEVKKERDKNPNFIYRAATANCGNDAIGTGASKAIAESLKSANADFMVVNCQEVDFAKTKKQLQKAIPEGYEVTLVSKMATHTKLSTQFHKGTGIATYVIHKKDVEVKVLHATEARITNRRVGGGSAYNKGGLVTNLELTKGDQKLTMQTVSGHLDSNSAQKRSRDWHKLHKEMASAGEQVAKGKSANGIEGVSNWSQLVKCFPNLVISGYDANTRNKKVDGTSINQWDDADIEFNPGLQSLYQNPLGGLNFSDPSTYKSNVANITTDDAAKKRKGYAKGGMLDFVSIADGTHNEKSVRRDVTKVQPEKGTGRDHDVIICPPPEGYNTAQREFDVVKNQMASRLARVAHELAAQIRALPETDRNKDFLKGVYNQLLTPNGILNQMMNLHAKKMACFNSFAAHLNTDLEPARASNMERQWFLHQPWLKGLDSNRPLGPQFQTLQNKINEDNQRIDSINKEEDPIKKVQLAEKYHAVSKPPVVNKPTHEITEFAQVKQKLFNHAKHDFPKLAEKINNLPYHSVNLALLKRVDLLVFSETGLMKQAAKLQEEKLTCFNAITNGLPAHNRQYLGSALNRTKQQLLVAIGSINLADLEKQVLQINQLIQKESKGLKDLGDREKLPTRTQCFNQALANAQQLILPTQSRPIVPSPQASGINQTARDLPSPPQSRPAHMDPQRPPAALPPGARPPLDRESIRNGRPAEDLPVETHHNQFGVTK